MVNYLLINLLINHDFKKRNHRYYCICIWNNWQLIAIYHGNRQKYRKNRWLIGDSVDVNRFDKSRLITDFSTIFTTWVIQMHLAESFFFRINIIEIHVITLLKRLIQFENLHLYDYIIKTYKRTYLLVSFEQKWNFHVGLFLFEI